MAIVLTAFACTGNKTTKPAKIHPKPQKPPRPLWSGR